MSSKTQTVSSLKKKHIPYILIPGILAAIALGWKADIITKIENYHELRVLFPASGKVEEVDDGDTFVLTDGIIVRLIGINTPEKGQPNYETAQHELYDLIIDKKVYLEYDRYQDDKFSRVLAWVWIDCEKAPKFLPADYMHKSNNESSSGLTANPEGCKNGKLVNEEMIKSKLAQPTFYKDRGELKYQARLKSI